MLLLLGAPATKAQQFQLQPTPQVYVDADDSIARPAQFRLTCGSLADDAPALSLLRTLGMEQADKAGFRIDIGIKGDKNIRSFRKKIPATAEGYYLKVDKNRIVIAAADARGAYYGVQSLAQLMTLDKLPLVEVTDYPDVPYRGVVEGFYGKPWSQAARLSQMDFYGRNKMNVYIYGPKDDPYHRSSHWRDPYPAEKAEELKQLVERAHQNHVIFYWAIHPGGDIKWNEEDRNKLMQKLESMYQLGVRGFAVFFDDIAGEGANPDKQVELLNYVNRHFVQAKPDVAPLIMCPTIYNKAWVKREPQYLPTLGNGLDPDIRVMWTGDRVVTTITRETLDFFTPELKRKAYLWWNFPVSDFCNDHLLMGPIYGNGLDLADGLSAFVSNPMEFAEASKVSLYCIADYTWNMDKFDSDRSWKRAMRALMPVSGQYLETFALHNADPCKNGHNFRRDESWTVADALQTLLQSYEKDGVADKQAYAQVQEECRRVVEAADRLMASGDENRPLVQEIEPWLIQTRLMGQYGLAVLQLLDAGLGADAFVRGHATAYAIKVQMGDVDATHNRHNHHPGIKSGDSRMMPTFDALYRLATERYNKQQGADLPLWTSAKPGK